VSRLPVKKTYKLFIGGAFPRSESGRTYVAEGQNVALASRKDVRDAVRAARQAQPTWAGMTAYNRGQVLYRVAELIETQPTHAQISRLVESSWPMGVVRRAHDGEADSTVRCISRRVPLPLNQREPPSDDERAYVKQLETQLAELRAQGASDGDIREANMHVRRAALDLSVNQRRSVGAALDIEFQAIRFGPTALVGIPVEPFAEIGVAVKNDSPFDTTFFSGYTNGVESYLAMPYAFEEGGYEVWMCPFAPEAAGITIEESLKLLQELHQCSVMCQVSGVTLESIHDT